MLELKSKSKYNSEKQKKNIKILSPDIYLRVPDHSTDHHAPKAHSKGPNTVQKYDF